jgi:hypothetical protein
VSTFRDAFLDARQQLEDGADPDVVVPPLIELAEAPDEIELAQALYDDEEDEEEQWR